MSLTRLQAERFARLPLAGLERIYPNHVSHAFGGPDDARTPDALHPIFYGCYDWHSAVHGHWLLARCLNRWPDLDAAAAIEALFDRQFKRSAGEAEASYFATPGREGFERPYGWAWLLVLAAELRRCRHENARNWSAAVAPIEAVLRRRILPYLDRLTYPVRAGTHANTAFALILMRHSSDGELRQAIDAAALRYFVADRDYPTRYEPSGEDFLSPGLVEAALLADILPPDHFASWFGAFLPDGAVAFNPAIVADRSDGRIAHLDGLNLSRSWSLRRIAAALTGRADLLGVADAHEAASLPQVESGHYAGEHWLATFATLAIDGL